MLEVFALIVFFVCLTFVCLTIGLLAFRMSSGPKSTRHLSMSLGLHDDDANFAAWSYNSPTMNKPESHPAFYRHHSHVGAWLSMGTINGRSIFMGTYYGEEAPAIEIDGCRLTIGKFNSAAANKPLDMPIEPDHVWIISEGHPYADTMQVSLGLPKRTVLLSDLFEEGIFASPDKARRRKKVVLRSYSSLPAPKVTYHYVKYGPKLMAWMAASNMGIHDNERKVII